MLKKFALVVILVSAMCFSFTAHAMRSNINPMSPRTTSVLKYSDDYSYGFSVLASSSIDSIEKVNRAFFFVNYNVFDKYILRPVAVGYSYLPNFIQIGTGNFFSNIDDATSILNHVFLGEVKDASLTLARFGINSTLGLLGLFDVAGDMGIEKKSMSLSTVLGSYGMKQGMYLHIPGYGPTAARDLQGAVVDGWPYFLVPTYVSIGAYIVEGVHNRAQLLEQDGLIANAIDPYVQMRDVFLMYEQGKVNKVTGISTETQDEQLDESFLDEIDSM